MGIRVRGEPAALDPAPAAVPGTAPLNTTLASQPASAPQSENPGAGLPPSVEEDIIPF